MAVTVTATYTDAAGTPASGTVEFVPEFTAGNDTTLITQETVVATLDENGAISVDLVASDDADWNDHTSVRYRVTEKIDGLQPRSYLAALDGATIDLSAVQT